MIGIDNAAKMIYNVREASALRLILRGIAMKKTTKNVFKVIISIIYIIWGIMSPISAIKAIIALDVPALISAGVSVLMLLAGIFGLFGMKRGKCKVFGVIILVFAILAVVSAFTAGAGIVNPLITAVLAWLFIICV